MQQEIEYIFKDGTRHVIPVTNQANFEKIFDKDISSQSIVGQNKPTVYAPKVDAPAAQTAQKEIIPFSLEEPKSEIAIPEIKVEEPVAHIPDEVIIIEEN